MISGAAKLAGVMGWPISHSKSPILHGYWLDHYHVDGAYIPMAVSPDSLGQAVDGLRALGFKGSNVTVPHKQAIMSYCDIIADDARMIGAVNTLVLDADGHITGSNTDHAGFIDNLRLSDPSWDPKSGTAVVLGAGGAARAVLYGLIRAGAPKIRVANRTLDRARALAEDFAPHVEVVAFSDTAEALADCALLVNTTSLGMTGQPPLDLRLDALPKSALVTDIVYAPLVTPLLAEAMKRGNRTVDGLGMLLHQAVPGFEAWFGVRPAVTQDLREIVLGTK